MYWNLKQNDLGRSPACVLMHCRPQVACCKTFMISCGICNLQGSIVWRGKGSPAGVASAASFQGSDLDV
jgi:hypothetical protein